MSEMMRPASQPDRISESDVLLTPERIAEIKTALIDLKSLTPETWARISKDSFQVVTTQIERLQKVLRDVEEGEQRKIDTQVFQITVEKWIELLQLKDALEKISLNASLSFLERTELKKQRRELLKKYNAVLAFLGLHSKSDAWQDLPGRTHTNIAPRDAQ